MKLIHICTDEKFIDAAWETFEALEPGKNRFLVLGEKRNLSHITKTPVEFIGKKFWKNTSLYRQLREASCVILHSLGGGQARLVSSKLSRDINFAWVGFGYDYYNFISRSEYPLYLSQTASVLKLIERGFLNFSSKSLRLKLGKLRAKCWQRKAIERICYFSPVLEAEYALVRLAFRDQINFPKLLRYNYGVNAKFFDKLAAQDLTRPGPNILLGNSANPTNNHIETIDLLASVDLGERIVIAPLSYGYGDKRYIEKVCGYGKEKLGDHFKALSGFLPYQEYVDLLGSCGIVLMNHKRQQALGNIQLQIARGASVFLRKDSPLFSWYEDMGVVVYDIESVSGVRTIDDVAMNSSIGEQNRKIVTENFGWFAHLKRTREFIDQVTNRGCSNASI